jgi:hypothetical protein
MAEQPLRQPPWPADPFSIGAESGPAIHCDSLSRQR